MKNRKSGKSLLTFILLVLAFFTQAAENKEDVILKALTDELNRNMQELKGSENQKPFFINYSAQSGKTLYIYGAFGALLNSQEMPLRAVNVRLLAGDYNFNDESLDNDISSPPTLESTDMPLEDDYAGIRRSLWIATDNVFKGAVKHFERNKLNLAEQKKPLAEIPHRSFSPVKPCEFIDEKVAPAYDKTALENYVRDLSAVFNSYDMLENSGVVLSYSYGNNYVVNSEGSKVKTYQSLLSLSCIATMKAIDGDKIFDLVQHYVSSPDKLPTKEMLTKEIKSMLDSLVKKSQAELFTDDYSGPVLFVGNSAAELFAQSLFEYNEGLALSNSINTGNGEKNDVSNSSELKMGKLLLSDKLTIKAIPKTKVWNSTELLGSFQVDNEGVMPHDELVLVENGILKNMLNDRTLTKADQQANGHQSGPGVISITCKEQVSNAQLKANLIKEAKEQGLEYALLVKSIKGSTGGNDEEEGTQMEVYKIALDTGKETYVRSAYLKNSNIKLFKKVMQSSSQQMAQNVNIGGRRSNLVSIICPDALLLKQVEVKGSEPNFFKEDTFVKHPSLK